MKFRFSLIIAAALAWLPGKSMSEPFHLFAAGDNSFEIRIDGNLALSGGANPSHAQVDLEAGQTVYVSGAHPNGEGGFVAVFVSLDGASSWATERSTWQQYTPEDPEWYDDPAGIIDTSRPSLSDKELLLWRFTQEPTKSSKTFQPSAFGLDKRWYGRLDEELAYRAEVLWNNSSGTEVYFKHKITEENLAPNSVPHRAPRPYFTRHDLPDSLPTAISFRHSAPLSRNLPAVMRREGERAIGFDGFILSLVPPTRIRIKWNDEVIGEAAFREKTWIEHEGRRIGFLTFGRYHEPIYYHKPEYRDPAPYIMGWGSFRADIPLQFTVEAYRDKELIGTRTIIVEPLKEP